MDVKEHFSNTRAQLAKMVAGSPAIGTGVPVSGTAHTAPGSSQATPAHGGGGGSSVPPSNGGGGGSSGNGGGFFSHRLWRNPDFLLGAVVSLIGSAGLLIWVLRVDPNEIQKSDQTHSISNIATATGAIPPGWTPGKKEEATPQARSSNEPAKVSQKQTTYARTFSCRNEMEREDGYAKRDIHNLDVNSQSLRVGSGCVLTQVNGNVSGLSGKHYRLSVADEAIPGNYYNCGDMGGSNDSLSRCTTFIGRWAGKEMRIAVLDDGYVNIN